ncbi:MCE family protein [Streptomyces meridianus]|uniref:MCE family protein n=1 Tax=Streptomyces meridianus TaxID=2938945 RepID=A0ABT0X7N5_9ACTN|nr:MCE family protein [Streptomyces meridianus]MCM2578330.1 MCE family protein [Streptomyces meridianus]
MRSLRPAGRRRGAGAAVVWAAAGAVLLTGCGFDGLSDLPLPGGAATGDDAYRVTVQFRDVLDLVPQSAVKVNNVTVGSVEKIELDGWQARVVLRVADSVKLPHNAVAELSQTSMLGEKYVALAAPKGVQAVGRLGDGDRIPLSRSSRSQEIEEVLSALSALLNGGGVAQLHTITVELNKALAGRENRVKSLLAELDTFIGGLDKQRKDIVRAMEGLDRLARTLRKEQATVNRAVDEIPPGLEVLAGQRKNLTRMLAALDDLSTVGTRVVKASRNDVVANLENLRPILARLNEAGADLPNALELLTTYPFPRSAAGAIRGDFTNLRITADLDLESVYGNLPEDSGKPKPGKPGKPKVPGLPDLPVPDLPDLPDTGKPPAVPCIPGDDCSDEEKDSGSGSPDDGSLCLPLCTGTQASYRTAGYPSGVNRALAELLTRGLLP